MTHPSRKGGSPSKYEISEEQWLAQSLNALGHPDPSSIMTCLRTDGDSSLEALVIWLENRVIRQWEVSEREALRRGDSRNLERYLEDLECPSKYLQSRSWRQDLLVRKKVILWIVSSAISELYADQKGAINNSTGRKDSRPDVTFSPGSDTFPLGFSTNDADVDEIAKALRMKYLLDLRALQNRVNQSIAEMQKLTVKQQDDGK
jgi:hypothetical protein